MYDILYVKLLFELFPNDEKKTIKGFTISWFIKSFSPSELLLPPLIVYYWQEIITEFEIVIHEAEARLKSFVTCKFDNYICAVYFSYIGEVFGFFNTKIAI